MCGRYSLRSSIEEIAAALGVKNVAVEELPPRFNIAPTQAVAVVRERGGERELQMLKWGLVPSWAKDVSIGSRLINARAETVTEKPSFRDAFKHRRLLIPSDGFYEWRREGARKQPFYFRMKDERPFAFAGLWERWQGEAGETLETCTILTTEANDILRPVHDRMPVIIAPGDYQLWLDTEMVTTGKLMPLLRPYPAQEMTAHPVGLGVNNPRSDNADLVAPIINSQ